MTDYKKLLVESEYIQQLLKEVSKVKDFSAVPERLYYEAVLTLNSGMADESTQGVLSAFVKMSDVSNLTDESMTNLLSKKPFVDMEEKINTKRVLWEYLKKYCFLGIGDIIILSFIILCGTDIIRNNSKIVGVSFIIGFVLVVIVTMIVFINDLRYILSPQYRDKLRGVLNAPIDDRVREMVYNADKIDVDMTPYINRLDFPDKAFLFMDKSGENKLGREFTKARRYTPEYYDIISRLEIKYYERVNN